MTIDVSSDACLGVPSPALDGIDRGTYVQKQRERGMPQVMKSDVRETRTFENPFEFSRYFGMVLEVVLSGFKYK